MAQEKTQVLIAQLSRCVSKFDGGMLEASWRDSWRRTSA